MDLSVFLEATRPELVHEDHLGTELATMASVCTLKTGGTLYELLWSPGFLGYEQAWELVVPLNEALVVLRKEWEMLAAHEQGGCATSRGRLYRFTENYLTACAEHPDARLVVFHT